MSSDPENNDERGNHKITACFSGPVQIFVIAIVGDFGHIAVKQIVDAEQAEFIFSDAALGDITQVYIKLQIGRDGFRVDRPVLRLKK